MLLALYQCCAGGMQRIECLVNLPVSTSLPHQLFKKCSQLRISASPVTGCEGVDGLPIMAGGRKPPSPPQVGFNPSHHFRNVDTCNNRDEAVLVLIELPAVGCDCVSQPSPPMVGAGSLNERGVVLPAANINRANSSAPSFASLELSCPHQPYKAHPYDEVGRQLGIVSAFQSGSCFRGSIYLTVDLPVDRSGGMVAETGDAVARWIGPFLGEPGSR